MQAYPGYGAIQMQAQKVEQEYAPKLQKLENEINAIKERKSKTEANIEAVEELIEECGLTPLSADCWLSEDMTLLIRPWLHGPGLLGFL